MYKYDRFIQKLKEDTEQDCLGQGYKPLNSKCRQCGPNLLCASICSFNKTEVENVRLINKVEEPSPHDLRWDSESDNDF